LRRGCRQKKTLTTVSEKDFDNGDDGNAANGTELVSVGHEPLTAMAYAHMATWNHDVRGWVLQAHAALSPCLLLSYLPTAVEPGPALCVNPGLANPGLAHPSDSGGPNGHRDLARVCRRHGAKSPRTRGKRLELTCAK